MDEEDIEQPYGTASINCSVAAEETDLGAG